MKKDDDVIIKVLRTCVCGSDLWAYRGLEEQGHEKIAVTKLLELLKKLEKILLPSKRGTFVIAPFTHGCGHCRACLAGFDGVCMNHDLSENFSGGYQAEYVRFSMHNGH